MKGTETNTALERIVEALTDKTKDNTYTYGIEERNSVFENYVIVEHNYDNFESPSPLRISISINKEGTSGTITVDGDTATLPEEFCKKFLQAQASIAVEQRLLEELENEELIIALAKKGFVHEIKELNGDDCDGYIRRVMKALNQVEEQRDYYEKYYREELRRK